MVLKQRKKIQNDGVPQQNGNIISPEPDQNEKPPFKWSLVAIVQNILKVFFFILIVPAFLNYAALLREEKELKPEGIFINVKNGQKLFKHCEGSGTPTVILDAPLGHTSDVWSVIAPSLAKQTKVCYYDRAGLGFSERNIRAVNESIKTGKPHTVERMVEDFHRLFDVEEKPFILVGADLGALVGKFYAQLYKDYVVGVIMINPFFEGLFQGQDNPWEKFWFQSNLPSLQLQHISSAFGVTRLAIQTGIVQEPYSYEQVSEEVKRRQKYLRCKPSHMRSVLDESHHLNESLAQIRVMGKLLPYAENIPTWLVWTQQYNENVNKERNQIWLRSQDMFENTFRIKEVSNIRLPSSTPAILFSHHDRITELVRKAVKLWRKKSTSSY